jgi:hypothetical protein
MDYAIALRAAIVEAGRAARLSGAAEDECRYMPGSDHALAWQTGFRNALSPLVFKADRIFYRGAE